MLISLDTKDIELVNNEQELLILSYIKTTNDIVNAVFDIEQMSKILNISKQKINSSLKKFDEKNIVNAEKIDDKNYRVIIDDNKQEVIIVEKTKKSKTYSQEVKDIAEKAINHLNQLIGKNMRPSTSYDIISARVNDGYKEEDFIKVIDNMYTLWHKDNHMVQYLRPGTLFSKGHFDDYLNKIVNQTDRRRARRKNRLAAEAQAQQDVLQPDNLFDY